MSPDSAAVALTPRIRAFRVSALGGASLLLATTAHLIGGGTRPGLGLLAVTALVLGLIAVAMTRRQCRTPVLLAVLSVEQVLLHVLFGAAPAMAGCAATGAHHAQVVGCAPMEATGSSGTGAVMLAGHAVAVLVTAWMLARGEAWIWRTVDEAVRAAHTGLTEWVGSIRRPVAVSALVPVRVRRDGPLPPRGPPIPR